MSRGDRAKDCIQVNKGPFTSKLPALMFFKGGDWRNGCESAFSSQEFCLGRKRNNIENVAYNLVADCFCERSVTTLVLESVCKCVCAAATIDSESQNTHSEMAQGFSKGSGHRRLHRGGRSMAFPAGRAGPCIPQILPGTRICQSPWQRNILSGI